MEYLIIKVILYNKSSGDANLVTNFLYILNELAKHTNNPLFGRISDPANTNNILSDLMSIEEKNIIIEKAKISVEEKYLDKILW